MADDPKPPDQPNDPPLDDPPVELNELDKWKRESRKHESRARKQDAENERLRKELQERDDGQKSEHEKSIAQARAEAKQEAEAGYQKALRATSLEVAVTRAAARPIKVGEETLRFADPDDAQMHIERMIRRGDLDEDELYGKNGKVDASVLSEALAELLQSRPHLAGGTNGHAPVKGSADGGKGSPQDPTHGLICPWQTPSSDGGSRRRAAEPKFGSAAERDGKRQKDITL